MSVTDERLMAYADGELSAAESIEVEGALENDPALREKLAAHKRLRTQFSEAFDSTLDEPVPDRLTAVTQGKASAAEVVDLATRRTTKWSVREWGAMAASVAAGLLMGLGVIGGQGPIAATDQGLAARGALARALDAQLASDSAGNFQMGLSFQNRDGEYCRTFQLQREGVAGLACRGGGDWRVAMTTAHALGGGEVRTAGSQTPSEILTAVENMIEGDVLDATGEARARAEGWHASQP